MDRIGSFKHALVLKVAAVAFGLWVVAEIPFWGRLMIATIAATPLSYLPTFLALCFVIALGVDIRATRLPKLAAILPILAMAGYYGTYAYQSAVVASTENRLSAVNAKTRFAFDPSRDSLFANREEVLIDLDIDSVFKRSNRVSTRAEFGLLSDEACARPDKQAKAAGLPFERLYKSDGRSPIVLGGSRVYPVICSVELRGDALGRPIFVTDSLFGKLLPPQLPVGIRPLERSILAISPDGVVGEYVTAEVMRLPLLPLPRITCSSRDRECGMSAGQTAEKLDTRPAGIDRSRYPEPVNVLLSIQGRQARDPKSELALLSRMTAEALSRKDPVNIEAAYRFVMDPTAEVPAVSDGTFLVTMRAARQLSRGSDIEQIAYGQAMVSKYVAVLSGSFVPERGDIARRGLGLALEDLLDKDFERVSSEVFKVLVGRNDRSYTEDRLFARTAAFATDPLPYYEAYLAKDGRPETAFAEVAALGVLDRTLPVDLEAVVKRNALSLLDVLSASGQAHVDLVSGVFWGGTSELLAKVTEDKRKERRIKRYEAIFEHPLPFQLYHDTRTEGFRGSSYFRRLAE